MKGKAQVIAVGQPYKSKIDETKMYKKVKFIDSDGFESSFSVLADRDFKFGETVNVEVKAGDNGSIYCRILNS